MLVQVDRQAAVARLTGREREIARLIGLGLINKEIASRLQISERTVAAHIQNIFNKLGANHRAQVATWSAEASARAMPAAAPAAPAAAPAATVPVTVVGQPAVNRRRANALTAACCAAVLLVAASDGAVPSVASSAPIVIPGDLPLAPGKLVYQAKMDGSGDDFGPPGIVGDPSTSSIRFVKGAVEFAVLKPGGLAGDNPVMMSLPGYFAEMQISVGAGSLVSFWFSLTQGDAYKGIGSYVASVNTWDEYVQLGYFVQGHDVTWLSQPAPLNRLLTGRTFTISVLVNPPLYQLFVDGRSVTSVTHEPHTPLQAPSFQIFGDGVGAVRMTSLRIYGLK